nr:ABC transporter permease [Sneathiella glossodoripedis]
MSEQIKNAEQGASPVPYRGGGFRPKPVRIVAPILFAFLIGFWEFGAAIGWISPLVLPAPSEAFAAFKELLNSGDLARHLGASLQRLIFGWTAGSLLGIAFGIAAGLFTLARGGIVPFVAAIFPIPKIALLPLFIIWFGIGEESKIATILFGTFFPTVIAVYGGIDNVDRNLIRMGQSFNLKWWSIVWKIILPGALPAILSGFRISHPLPLFYSLRRK